MCSTCRAYEARGCAASLSLQLGAVAQLEERVTGSHEVVGSSPISSTSRSNGFMLGGLVAGEGCFTTTRWLPPFADEHPRLRFKFSVEMASRDRQLLERLRDFLGRGSIHDTPPAGRAGSPRAPFSSPHRSVTTRRPSLSPRHISWTPASGGSSRNGRRLSEDTRTRTSGVRGEVALRAQWSGVTSQCAVKASAVSTTIVRPATERVVDFVSGFVVAEGCFTRTGSPPKFTFSLALGAADATTCTLLKSLFGVGFVLHSPRRKPHYDDEVVFQVRRMKDLLTVIVPFMDEHLPPSYKRVQYKI